MPTKHRITLLVAVFALIASLAGAGLVRAAPAAPAAIQYKMRSLRQSRKGYYAMRLNYPVFEGNSKLAEKANTTIRSIIAQNVNGFIKDAVKAHGTPMNQPWFLGEDCNVGLSRADLISVCFTVHGYFGGATDTLSPQTFTFGWRNGNPAQLNLSDIFAKSGNPEATLSQVVMPMLRQKKAAFVLDGSIKSLSDASGSWGWYLNGKKTLTVEIAEGIVGSHADGPFTLNIPLAMFDGKLKKDGPLATLAGGTQPQAAGGAPAIHYRIKTLSGHRSSYYTYEIKYPVFAGNTPLVAYANWTIRTWAAKTVSDFRKEAVRDHETGPLAFGWETEATPEIGLARSDVISLCFHCYIYSGGANGTEFPKTFSFGLRNGHPALLQLSDIFAGSNPANTLSPVVISDLRKKQASSVLDGTVKNLATIDGTWGWYLKKGLLVVEIGQEAAGSHAEGTFTLNIPLSTFAGKLNTHGPLSAMFGQ